jgi:hypothetical protein
MKYFSVIIVTCLFCGCGGTQSNQKQVAAHRPRLNDKFITGHLGYPLGTYLRIEGVRKKEGRSAERILLVDRVNGKKLPKIVEILIDNIKYPGLPEDTRCVIKGYESGRMIGVPDEVAKAENIPVSSAEWQFMKYFVITSIVEPQSLEKQ